MHRNGNATAAFLLEGMDLPGGWRVTTLIKRPPQATGGHFSVGYLVVHAERGEAFLKALDYSSALADPDPARALEALTSAYNFERDLLAACRRKGLSRVIRLLDDGKVEVHGAVGVPLVNYLIFEKAEGDIRAHLDALRDFDVAFALRALHHVATALQQLHSHNMAHQDLKPSNVLVMTEGDAKVTDLGRAAYKGHASPFDDLTIAGDWGYAPPELLYGHRLEEWVARSTSCDLYLLGSMATFLFQGVAMSPLLFAHLHPKHTPVSWSGTYREVLPYVREAFNRVIEAFEVALPDQLRPDLGTAVRHLCDPDPALRGHPRNRVGQGSSWSLERFITKFDLLATRAEHGLLREAS